MKKKWIIIACVIIALALALMRVSFVAARSALQGDIVRQKVNGFTPDKAFLSVEPNTGDVCWTFVQTSWHDALAVHVSLLGNPMSFGRMKWMETDQQKAEDDAVNRTP
jgi:hypothetical protein